jgi:drug/metabolite transporter (DMT)-like permease
MSSRTHLHFTTWLIFIFLCLTWGSSFILIKKGLLAFTADEVAALRICISACAFLPIYFFLTKERVPVSKLAYIALAALLGNGVPAFFFAVAQTHVDSSVAGILNSLTPIFTWILGLMFFAAAFRTGHLAGVILGFAGAGVIILFNHRLQFNLDTYSLLIVVATMCYGASANVVKRYLQDVGPVAISAMALFIIGVPALAYLATTDIAQRIAMRDHARTSLLAIAVLALFGTALANILFYRLIQRTSAVFASSVAYLIPVTALAWGLLDGEVLGIVHVTGMAMILIGVWMLRK